MKRLFFITILISMSSKVSVAQELYSDLYQYNYSSINPAFVGTNGTRMTFWGTVFDPIDNAVPHERNSAFMGFETRAKKISSGFGANVSAWRWTRFSSLSTNLLYNYYIPIGEESEVIIGGMVGVFSFSYDLSTFFTPIDQFDPLIPDGPSSSTAMQVGLAALYKTKKWFAGLSAENRPHEDIVGATDFRLSSRPMQINSFAGLNAELGRISTTHSLYAMKLPNYWRVDLNTSGVFLKWLIAGVSLQIEERDIVPKANAGIKFKDVGQVVVMLYSQRRAVAKDFSGQLMLMFNL